MLKHIYKLLGLIIAFVVALMIFGQNIRELKTGGEENDEVVSQDEEALPVIELVCQNYHINRLFGYSGNMAAGSIRETITPISEKKELSVLIDKYNTEINKMNYEVRLVTTGELIDSGAVSVFDTDKNDNMSVKLDFDVNFLPSTEYTLKLTLVTDVSKKISYYTRLKYYPENSNYKAKLDFVKSLHEMTKEKDEKLSSYIESNPAADNTSFAYVDINSSFYNITWGDLSPVELTDIVPDIKEYNMETASISLVYFAKMEVPSGFETYYVKEYYRVKYSEGRAYLLWFERSVEAEYDVLLTSVKKNQLKIGISQTKDIQLMTNNSNTRLAFVRNNNLYEYDFTENRIKNIYSGYISGTDYVHKLYRQQDINILSIDEEGNICFAVYGYIAHGAYEGKVAVVLYRYNMTDNVITELLYIPFEMTYQMLRHEFEKNCYINAGDVFYFSINNSIYSYSIITDKLTCIVEGLKENEYTVIPETHSYVWEAEIEGDHAHKLVMLNMDTGAQTNMYPPEDGYIKLIGVIGSNVVYGIGKMSDIGSTAEGVEIEALKKVEIADENGSVVKSYKKKGYYVVEARIEDNVVYLDRCKKSAKGYVAASGDNIINRSKTTVKQVNLTSRVTKKALTEWYIDLPSSVDIEKAPDYSTVSDYLVTEEHPIYLDYETNQLRYYVYAKGEIKAAYNSPAEAIVYADSEQGVVIANNNQVIWERGGRYNSHIVAGITEIKASGGVSSMEACAHMLLSAVHVSTDSGDIKKNNKSIFDILNSYVDNAVNLTGCTFDEVLYYVSGDRPVIGMTDSNHAVIITAYTTTMATIYDPEKGTSENIPHLNASSMFEKAGNVFISIAR